MIADMAASLARPSAYRRFCAERGSRTAAYIAFLSLIFVGALAVSMKLRLAPMFNETFDWLGRSMPALRFSGGKVSSEPPGPVRIEHPKYGMALMVDTGRTEPVTSQTLKDAKVHAYLTSHALYVDQGGGRVKPIDFRDAASERPMIVDAATYREMQKAFNWVFYPTLTLLAFTLFALSLAALGVLYALGGMLIASISGAALGFGALFSIGVHAQTAGALLRSLDMALPVAVPYAGLLSFALTVAYLWLGVRAALPLGGPPHAGAPGPAGTAGAA